MEIIYVKNKHIDKIKYDKCIINSINASIYAHSWYLDTISDYRWDCIVIDDYKSVLPLPYHYIFFIKRYCRPLFSQQLGLIYYNATYQNSFNQILDIIIKKRHKGTIVLNSLNQINQKYKGTYRTNLILNLNQNYDQIQNKYSQSQLRNLKKANQNNLKLIETNDYEIVIELYKKEWQRKSKISNSWYDRFLQICILGKAKNNLTAYLIKTEQNEIISGCIIMHDRHRIYYPFSANSPKGRLYNTNIWMIDQIIKKYANKPLIFDFEGSDIESVKSFYLKFGSINEPYFELKL